MDINSFFVPTKGGYLVSNTDVSKDHRLFGYDYKGAREVIEWNKASL